MTFLDKKEQVLDIQLTQYGKYLLSKGKLKPVYYSFFDDDVLYDSTYAGITEQQNETQDRILNQARTETQYVYDGLETNIRKAQELVRSGLTPNIREKIQKTPEKHYALSAPIGNSSLMSNKMPAWNLDVLYGEISGSISYSTGSHQTLRIPQINVDTITYETFTKRATQTPEEFEEERDFSRQEGQTSDLTLASDLFKDGTYIDVKEDYLLLQIREENSVFSNENFDVEMFLVEEEKTDVVIGSSTLTNEVLVPLVFDKKKPKIVNNILLDEEEEENVVLDPTYADYYFYVHIDDEIDRDVLCRASPTRDKTLSEVKSLEDFECPRPTKPAPDIYISDVDLCDDVCCPEIDFEAS